MGVRSIILLCVFVYPAPGSAPINISVINKSTQYLELTWSPPELSYGIITNYTIQFDKGTGLIMRTSNMNRYSISQLQPYQTISVMISATNSIGSGPFSDPTDFTTNESSKTTQNNNISF